MPDDTRRPVWRQVWMSSEQRDDLERLERCGGIPRYAWPALRCLVAAFDAAAVGPLDEPLVPVTGVGAQAALDPSAPSDAPLAVTDQSAAPAALGTDVPLGAEALRGDGVRGGVAPSAVLEGSHTPKTEPPTSGLHAAAGPPTNKPWDDYGYHDLETLIRDWLDAIYPETIFDGSSGDPGAIIVAQQRALLKARAALATPAQDEDV